MKIKNQLIKNLLIVFSLFTFFGCGNKTTVHHIYGGSNSNIPPFGPAIMEWPDGAELFCKFGANFKIDGLSIFYAPKPSNDSFIMVWEKGNMKTFGPNYPTEKEREKILIDYGPQKWVDEKLQPLVDKYFIKGPMSVGKAIIAKESPAVQRIKNVEEVLGKIEGCIERTDALLC